MLIFYSRHISNHRYYQCWKQSCC